MAWLAMVLAACAAVFPLVSQGPSCGHDFSFHLQSWLEASSQWRHGILRPVWVFSAAWNAGEPRLLFYPPLSWVIGGLLTLVLPWSAVPCVYTALCLLLSGATMRRLVLRWAAPPIALLAACLYMVTPYMLFVAYTRTAYSELLAAAWMPLLLDAVLRERVRVLHVAAAVALLWITNAPAAVIGCYSLVLVGMLRMLFLWRKTHDVRRIGQYAITVAAGAGLGLLLDAWYLVPLAHQRSMVQMSMAVLPDMNPVNNFLFTHPADPARDHVLQRVSWLSAATLAVALGAWAAVLLGNRQDAPQQGTEPQRVRTNSHSVRTLAVLLLVFCCVIVWLQTRLSTFVWRGLPEMMFLQFPWRWLVMGSAVAVVLLALALRKIHLSLPACAGIGIAVALAAGFASSAVYREDCDPPLALQQARQAFQAGQGVEPTDEYTPTDADNDVLKTELPETWTASEVDALPAHTAGEPGIVTVSDGNPEHLQMFVPAAESARYLVVRLRQYHGWRVTVDGSPVRDLPRRDDGLLCIPMDAGHAHEVQIRLEVTADRWIGGGITLLALAASLPFAERRRMPPQA